MTYFIQLCYHGPNGGTVSNEIEVQDTSPNASHVRSMVEKVVSDQSFEHDFVRVVDMDGQLVSIFKSS